MTSGQLVDRREVALREGAAARVGGLFERHGRMVYGVCRAMLRDVHEAEDAAQQVFLSAHDALLGGAEIRDPARWLAAIARNECRSRIVAGMRAPLPVADEDLDLIPSLRDEQARYEQVHRLEEALAALPERQREAAVLRYLCGLRYREVAVALGLSRPATEALLFRARRALRRRLAGLTGAALVVPSSLREELALALPGFSRGAGPSVAAVGAAGGVLAKLAAAPGGVKVVTTAAAAASTIGTVGTMQSDRPARGDVARAAVVRSVGSEATAAESRREITPRTDRSRALGESDRSGSRGDELEQRPSNGTGNGHGGSSGSGPSGSSGTTAQSSRSGSSDGGSSGSSGSSGGPDRSGSSGSGSSGSSGSGPTVEGSSSGDSSGAGSGSGSGRGSGPGEEEP